MRQRRHLRLGVRFYRKMCVCTGIFSIPAHPSVCNWHVLQMKSLVFRGMSRSICADWEGRCTNGSKISQRRRWAADIYVIETLDVRSWSERLKVLNMKCWLEHDQAISTGTDECIRAFHLIKKLQPQLFCDYSNIELFLNLHLETVLMRSADLLLTVYRTCRMSIDWHIYAIIQPASELLAGCWSQCISLALNTMRTK